MSSKSWQRPWSIEEIVENASNWSLAGDAGLLKYLETFSEKLLSEAETTNNSLNGLLSRLNDTSLSLDEVKNDFRSLRNTQFIESRVYEDDETAPDNVEDSMQDKQKNNSQSEESKIQDMKEAILAGIAVVEKYFDKVEVPGSDSEDEMDFPSFILKPRDPYADRPLPYVIGTDEWYKKWHVGLVDSSSDSEPDKVSEKYSESDSESDLTKDKIINHPVANSTFHEGLKLDLFEGSDVEDNNSTPSYVSTNRNFASELASKLDSFVDERIAVNEEEINKRPINKATKIQNFGNLVSDEPPPMDDYIDNNNVKGLFSGGESLFDDVDNTNNLWNEEQRFKTENKSAKPKVSGLFDDDLENDLFNDTISYGNDTGRGNQNESKKSGGLFDDEDDELFNNNSSIYSKGNTSYLQPNLNSTVPFIANEPPDIKPRATESPKKPVGGVKIMDTSDLLAQLKQRRKNSSSSESETKPDSVPAVKTSPKKKTLSLFDDDDDDNDFERDLFAVTVPRKEVKVAEITEKETETKSSSHNNSFIAETKTTESKVISLFDDEQIPPQPKARSSLSGNDVSKLSQPETVPQLAKDIVPEPKVISLFRDKAPQSKTISLFGEDDEDKPDDLFSDSLFSAKPTPQNQTPIDDVHVPPLFDTNPPELDDNWDARSDNLFEDNDTGLFDNIPEMSSQRSGLFDNEPPSLFFESSGIVRDISTRGAPDESFSPYASSSRRLSSDIFNEQQSNDSFFVTKNEVHSNLDIIPEASYTQASDSSESKIEVTPSGNEDDLFSDSTAISDSCNRSDSLAKNSSDKIEHTPPKGSPSKLKHNLKINVNALMPGASPPKKQSAERTVSLEVPSTEEENVKRLSLKSTGDSSTFENVVKDVEVLSSITKARAKIPFKRTPSTRRGRQEALRKSVPDFNKLSPDTETATSTILPHSKSEDFIDIFAEASNNAKVVDYFKEPQNQTDVLSIAKKVVSVEEEVLKKPVVTTDTFASDDYKQLNLFDDAEDDDMFSTVKLPPKSTIISKSLFNDDDDDDDDVFGTSSSSKKETFDKNVSKTIPKKPAVAVKKLENSEVVEDPLSSFLDE